MGAEECAVCVGVWDSRECAVGAGECAVCVGVWDSREGAGCGF